mmetsp:Transcript_9016/g.22354  ORF Transcript_9016/g.22354 Transcript_9016/m.22354 type:complete len:143 (+) Transcript_9016:214-642(+)
MVNRTLTCRRMIFILFSLSIIADRCFGFLPATTTKLAGRHPAELAIRDTQQTLAMVSPSPDVEAEVLTTMAHVTMDFGGFVLNPSKTLLRCFIVLGRICAISADYVIDHSIHPEELMIQLVLMTIAIKELVVDSPASSNQTK